MTDLRLSNDLLPMPYRRFTSIQYNLDNIVHTHPKQCPLICKEDQTTIAKADFHLKTICFVCRLISYSFTMTCQWLVVSWLAASCK